MSEAQRDGDDGGARVRVRVAGEQTQQRYALVELVARPGEEPPLHTHTRETEVIHVLRGEITVQVDGRAMRCAAGEGARLPPGSEHTYAVMSDEATLLLLLTPAGLEAYYRELDSPIAADRRVERLIAASARYGIEIVGPGDVAPPVHAPNGAGTTR